jgi:hypothetical protein
MRKVHFLAATLATTVALAGCLGTGEDRVLSIDATGTVQGVVFFDGNGTREFDDGDTPLVLVRFRLLPFGTPDTIARAVSDAEGNFSIPRVPVGGYRLVVDPASIGDSVNVLDLDPAEFFVQPDDSVTSVVTVGFEGYTIEEARARPIGEKVFVSGIVLIENGLFGDSTLHIADASGAIRATRVQRTVVVPGDSVRLLGEVDRRDGSWTLDDVTVFLLDATVPPIAEPVNSNAAASADAGRLDAALVRLVNAEITDTVTVDADFQLTVDDGSGPAVVLLDSNVAFTELDAYVPGVSIDATGVLVPAAPGQWSLKPRSDADLVLR